MSIRQISSYLGPSAKMRLAASTVLIASTLFIVFAKTRKSQGDIGGTGRYLIA